MPDTGANDIWDEFKNEVTQGNAKDCDKLDPTLMRRVIDFSKRLKKITYNNYPLYLVLTSCYRSQFRQRELHYARMITWSDSEIQTNVKDATTKEKALQIQKNALEAFKKLENINDDNEAKKQAEAIRDSPDGFGANPAYAAEDNCPCGCGWPRSKHTFNPAMAIDANVFANDAWVGQGGRFGDTKIVGRDSRPNTPHLNEQKLYSQIEQASNQSGLEWGINWSVNTPPYVPIDPVHWEPISSKPPETTPTPPTFPPNPGPLPSWDLRNNSQGGHGPLARGDSRKDLVKHLQEMLIAFGYNLGSYGADGIFGSNTETAVRQFQSSHSDFNRNALASDALVGPLTADSINRAMQGKWYNNYTVPKLLVQHYEEVRTGRKVILPDDKS